MFATIELISIEIFHRLFPFRIDFNGVRVYLTPIHRNETVYSSYKEHKEKLNWTIPIFSNNSPKLQRTAIFELINRFRKKNLNELIITWALTLFVSQIKRSAQRQAKNVLYKIDWLIEKWNKRAWTQVVKRL